MAKHEAVEAVPVSNAGLCACEHHEMVHDPWTGHCYIAGCGCKKLRDPLPPEALALLRG